MNPLAKLIYKEVPTVMPERVRVSSEIVTDVYAERASKLNLTLLMAEQIDGITIDDEPAGQPTQEEATPVRSAVEPVAQAAVSEVMNSKDANVIDMEAARTRLQAIYPTPQGQDTTQPTRTAA